MIEITVRADEADLDRALAVVKEQFPAAAALEKVRLETAVGVRAELNTPVGRVEALVRLTVQPGG